MRASARARVGVRACVLCMCLCLCMCACVCERLLLYVHAPRRLEEIRRARRHRRLLHLFVRMRVHASVGAFVRSKCTARQQQCACVCVRARAECLEEWLFLVRGCVGARLRGRAMGV